MTAAALAALAVIAFGLWIKWAGLPVLIAFELGRAAERVRIARRDRRARGLDIP